MATLETFLKKYLPYTDPSPMVNSFSTSKSLKKKTIITRPGNYCDYLAFIKEGTFRVYFDNDEGIEITVWFSFAGMMVTDMLAFYTQKRASFFVEAVEDSEIRILKKSQLEDLYQKCPPFQEFGRKYAEYALTVVMQRMLTLQNKTAEERYRELINQPNFMKKIPLKHLATYLGITDSSLSRIRKNFS